MTETFASAGSPSCYPLDFITITVGHIQLVLHAEILPHASSTVAIHIVWSHCLYPWAGSLSVGYSLGVRASAHPRSSNRFAMVLNVRRSRGWNQD